MGWREWLGFSNPRDAPKEEGLLRLEEAYGMERMARIQ